MKDSTRPYQGQQVAATSLRRRLFSPSLVDRLMDAVERLPIPYWLTYLLVLAVWITVVHAAAWVDGTIPPLTLHPVLLLVPFRIVAPLMLMTYLDRVAIDSLAAFRPLLSPSDDEAGLRYQLTNMPALPALIAGLLASSTITPCTNSVWCSAYMLASARSTYFGPNRSLPFRS